jgi:hypothetical protein
VNLSCAFKRARERPNSTLSDWHISSTVEVQQAQRILGAMAHVGVSAHACYRKEIQLRSHDGAGNRQRIIKPRIAIDDDREWLTRRADWGDPRS